MNARPPSIPEDEVQRMAMERSKSHTGSWALPREQGPPAKLRPEIGRTYRGWLLADGTRLMLHGDLPSLTLPCRLRETKLDESSPPMLRQESPRPPRSCQPVREIKYPPLPGGADGGPFVGSEVNPCRREGTYRLLLQPPSAELVPATVLNFSPRERFSDHFAGLPNDFPPLSTVQKYFYRWRCAPSTLNW